MDASHLVITNQSLADTDTARYGDDQQSPEGVQEGVYLGFTS